MNNESPIGCPQCGAPLPKNAPAGLCPNCLIKMAMASGTVAGQDKPGFTPPSIEELAKKFPQLEVIELIGRGGMGAVYKARQKELDRLVALKILPPGIGDDAAFAERFAREAKALAKLNHPGIVTLYEFGRTELAPEAGTDQHRTPPTYFFLMEYVDGVNLRQLMASGRVSPREALAIVPQICDALQFAHDQGIVHRDIKPENVLLDRRGHVKVADFGLAKLVGEEPSFVVPPSSGGQVRQSPDDLTRQHAMGTPHYMAPEQMEHPADVDHRADIYALGVVFYQMLTGELPGKSIQPPSTKVHIDVRLDEVVLRALEKQPDLRYQQVSEVKTMVEAITSSAKKPFQAATSVKQKRETSMRIKLGYVILFIAVCAALGLGGWYYFADKRSPAQIAQEGWRLWQSQQWDAAAEQFSKAVKRSPKDANAWNGLGWASFNGGKAKEGEQAFQRAVALQPDHPAALNGLGQICLQQRRYDEAEKYLLKAAPQAPAAWYGLARIYLLQGKFTQAEEYAQRIVDSGQGDDVSKAMLNAAKEKRLSDGLRFLIEPRTSATPQASLPTKTIVLARATNSAVGEGGLCSVSVWSDATVLPTERLRATVKRIDGQITDARSLLFTRWTQDAVTTSTSFNWSFSEEHGFGATEAEAATLQIRDRYTKRPLTLKAFVPLEVFCVTNREGGSISGYIEFERAEPQPPNASGEVKVTVKIQNSAGYIPSISYTAKVPDGYALRASASEGEASTHTPSGPYEYHSSWFRSFRPGSISRELSWNLKEQAVTADDGSLPVRQVPDGNITNRAPRIPRPRFAGQPQFEPFEVILGKPKLIFSITNGPGDVYQGFLELVGPSANPQASLPAKTVVR